MKSHILIPIVIAWALLLGLSRCIKEGNNTIIFLGYEDYIPPIDSVVPQALLKAYRDSIGDIPTGYIPPKVEGSFLVSPKLRVLSNNLVSWPLEVIEPDMSLSISNQHNGVIVNLECAEAIVTPTDSVYVMGHDNRFTIYFKEAKRIEDQGFVTVITRAMMITGEVREEGIRDLHYADIIIDVNDDSNGLIVQYPPGQYFIYKDGTGLSSRL